MLEKEVFLNLHFQNNNLMKFENVILSSAYIPPIQYFCKILQSKKVFIEQHDHYHKQSYRNRCHLYSPNGLQILTIPVKKTSGLKTKVKNVEISYDENWHLNHIRSFEAAYRSSPYYEYYMPDIENMLKNKPRLLIDLNQDILTFFITTLEIESSINLTNEFKNHYDFLDCRDKIHPKRNFNQEDSGIEFNPYYQIFQEKHGFIHNLSIIDLLFNEGPNSLQILESYIS